jgi:hypothetical protein
MNHKSINTDSIERWRVRCGVDPSVPLTDPRLHNGYEPDDEQHQRDWEDSGGCPACRALRR